MSVIHVDIGWTE